MIPLYFQGLFLILSIMTILWVISIVLKNVSIVDMFWGLGFVMVNTFYYFNTETTPAKIILFFLVAIWGLRLSFYLARRNIGKPEDYRYQEFRKKYGVKNFWWISFFQTFLLQGILMWIISMPLLGVNLYSTSQNIHLLDYVGILIWIIGFIFEAGGDMQLALFKQDKSNSGKVLSTGLWHYTRHPNYFGDSAVWWGYGMLCLSTGSYWLVSGSIIMTLLILKVSGVVLLEKSLKEKKPDYENYIRKTSSFIPWFPKK